MFGTKRSFENRFSIQQKHTCCCRYCYCWRCDGSSSPADADFVVVVGAVGAVDGAPDAVADIVPDADACVDDARLNDNFVPHDDCRTFPVDRVHRGDA